MVFKIQEAVAARTDPNLIIIGRTNAQRLHGLDRSSDSGVVQHQQIRVFLNAKFLAIY